MKQLVLVFVAMVLLSFTTERKTVKQIPTFKVGVNGERMYSKWVPFKRNVPKKYVVPFKRF